MEASCGPTNALSQLTKHTQRDTSLQHERPQQLRQQPGFRSQPGVDANLNQDFLHFASGSLEGVRPQLLSMGPGFGQHVPMAQSNMGRSNMGQSNMGQSHMNQSNMSMAQPVQGSGWVQDFNKLLLAQGRSQISQGNQMGSMRSGQLQHQGFGYGQAAYNSMAQSQWQGQTMGQAPVMQTSHQDSTPQFDEEALAAHFEQIELDMVQEEAAQQAARDNDAEREEFAAAARQVRNSMLSDKQPKSDDTAAKFEQSNFLKLMSLISEREVELSAEGDRLVQRSTGEDIREYLSDPLRHERAAESESSQGPPLEEQPDYHRPMFEHGSSTAPKESESIRSHLPDPLAHIKDGALASDLLALQAAQVISGGQVQGSSWMEDEMWDAPANARGSILTREEQEVYDDYRNMDDHHH